MCDYLNITTSDLYGTSLTPLIEGNNVSITPFAAGNLNENWMVKEGNYKYILKNTKEACIENKKPKDKLFNLAKDINEKNDISEGNKSITNNLKRKICRIYQEGLMEKYSTEKTKMDKAVEKRLRNLGYLE